MTMPEIHRRNGPRRLRTRSGTATGVLVGMLCSWLLILAGCGSSDDEISAQFTGDGCTYSGPTEFEIGDDFEITVVDVTDQRMDVGFAVDKVRDGTRLAEIREEGISEFVTGDHGTFLWSEITEEGTERVMSTTLDVAGTWVVNCFVFNPDGDFPATTFEVVGDS